MPHLIESFGPLSLLQLLLLSGLTLQQDSATTALSLKWQFAALLRRSIPEFAALHSRLLQVAQMNHFRPGSDLLKLIALVALPALPAPLTPVAQKTSNLVPVALSS